MPTVAKFGLDVNGSSENRVVAWDFKLFPEIVAGDTLSSAVVEFTPASPALTFGAPAVSGTQIQATLTVTGGVQNAEYKTTCTATTAAGRVLIAYGDIVLVGPS